MNGKWDSRQTVTRLALLPKTTFKSQFLKELQVVSSIPSQESPKSVGYCYGASNTDSRARCPLNGDSCPQFIVIYCRRGLPVSVFPRGRAAHGSRFLQQLPRVHGPLSVLNTCWCGKQPRAVGRVLPSEAGRRLRRGRAHPTDFPESPPQAPPPLSHGRSLCPPVQNAVLPAGPGRAL